MAVETEPKFRMTHMAQFAHPTEEMPDRVREMLAAGAALVFRYATDDGRIAWVPVTPSDMNTTDNLESFVNGLALKVLDASASPPCPGCGEAEDIEA